MILSKRKTIFLFDCDLFMYEDGLYNVPTDVKLIQCYISVALTFVVLLWGITMDGR